MYIIINGTGLIINKSENIEYVQDGLKVGDIVYIDIEVKAVQFSGDCEIGNVYDNGNIIILDKTE